MSVLARFIASVAFFWAIPASSKALFTFSRTLSMLSASVLKFQFNKIRIIHFFLNYICQKGFTYFTRTAFCLSSLATSLSAFVSIKIASMLVSLATALFIFLASSRICSGSRGICKLRVLEKEKHEADLFKNKMKSL